MIRVLFIGEGKADVGHDGDHDETPYEGDLVLLVQRILAEASEGGHVEVVAIRKLWTDVKTRGARRREEKYARGFAAKLPILLAEAERRDAAQAAIAVVDGYPDGSARLKDLRSGVQHAEQAGTPLALHCAVGVAIREIEAWLLADDHARRVAFGASVGVRSLPASPEDIEDPKSVLTHLHGEARARSEEEVGMHDRRRAIVAQLRLDEVARRCSRGFKPFRDEVRRKLGPLLPAGEVG